MKIRVLIAACLCGGSVWAARVDFDAGPAPRTDRAILRVPCQIGIREVDGRAFKAEPTLKPVRELQLELTPGTHNIILQFYDPFGGEVGLSPAHLRSENMLIAFDAEAGRVYLARFKTPEQAVGDEPRRFRIWIENESHIMVSRRLDEPREISRVQPKAAPPPQETPWAQGMTTVAPSPEPQWVVQGAKGRTTQASDDSLGSVLRLFNERTGGAPAPASRVETPPADNETLLPLEPAPEPRTTTRTTGVRRSTAPAWAAPQAPASVATPVNGVPQISNLDLLKLWWSKATVEERRAFMSWIVGQRN